MTSAETSNEFKSLVSQNSNLDEVQAFLRGGEASTLAPEILLSTLVSCVSLLRQNNMHVEEHVNLIETLRAANAELKELVASTQARLDSHIEDNSALVNTLSSVAQFHEQMKSEHEQQAGGHEQMMDQVSILNERIERLKETNERDRHSDRVQISQLRTRLAAMNLMRH